MFHKLRVHGEITNIKQAQVHYSNISDTRSIAISFTYKFGKETSSTKRNRQTGAAESEQQRVGGNR